MGTLHTHILHLPPNTHSKNMSCICALNVVAKAATTGAIKIQPGKKYADIKEAVKAGAVAGCAPFPEGVDAFGFFNGIDAREAQRYADVEITHGRISMLAALGFLVGEQVEGCAFIFTIEASRVQYAWQNPFDADKLFLLKTDYTPGDYAFDPLNLSKGKDEAWLNDMKLKEINN